MWVGFGTKEKIPLMYLNYNFMPAWWYHNFGFEFGEKVIFDPLYRMELQQAMQKALYQRFGDIGLGEENAPLEFSSAGWENATMQAFAGCNVAYPIDNYPWGEHLPADRILDLSVPEDVRSVFPFNDVIRQTEWMNQHLGTNQKPIFSPHGVLNESIQLRGTEFLGDMLVNPEEGKRILDFIFALNKGRIGNNINSCKKGGWCWTLINCSVVMVGPRIYEELLLGYDQAQAQICRDNGFEVHLHHCGTIDSYLDAYRKIGQIDFFEIGSGSNIRTILDAFPNARVGYIVDAALIAFGTKQQMKEKLESILEQTRGDWHRFGLSVSDIEYGAPDENLRMIFEMVKAAK